MQAQDVMTTKVVSVPPETSVAEIAKLLLESRISAVPVVDADGRLLGVVSEGDLIRRLHDGDEKRSWWLDLLASPVDRAQAYVRSHGRLARDVMTAQVVTVEEHTPLTEIARLLETRRIKRVPVIRDNRIVGIVSRADLPRGLALQPTAAQPASDDRGLRQQLLATFERAGLRWHSYVNLVVSGGKVHLWGLVESREEAEALRLAAQNVPGVAEVESHLAIRGTGPD